MDTFIWILLAIYTAPLLLLVFVGLFIFWVVLPTVIIDWAVRK